MIIAGGIDIGSNSFRLLLAEIRDGRLSPLANELVMVRLGEGLGLSGMLAPAAMQRAEAALLLFTEKMAAYPIHSLRACATHAVRTATNSPAFLQRAQTLTGISIQIISGEEEAHLALLGALSTLSAAQRRLPLLLADVGAGSSELILQTTSEGKPQKVSLPLGAVGLTEEFGVDFRAMRVKIRAILTPALQRIIRGEMTGTGFLLLACGGTATSLAALALGLDRYDAKQVDHYQLSQTELPRLITWLASLSPEGRKYLPCLADRRGEIIVAGAMILQELQQALATPILVSNAGLLEGILLSGTTDC